MLKLCDLFDKPLPNGVTITSLTFKEGALTLGGLFILRYNSLEKLYREVEKVISHLRDA